MNRRNLRGISGLWLVIMAMMLWAVLPALAQTEEPTADPTVDATEAPVMTDEPVETDEPSATEEPAATEDPAATDEPIATDEPAATDESAPTAVATSVIEPHTSDEGDVCDFDLDTVRGLLDEAEAVFASGDVETAVSLLDDVRAAVNAVRFECQPIPDLVETAIGDILTIGIPEGWVTRPEDVNSADGSLSFITGTTQEAISNTSASFPNLRDDQMVIGILWVGPGAVNQLTTGSGEVSLDIVVESLMTNMDSSPEAILLEPEPLTVQDWRAQTFRISMEGSNAAVYVVELERGSSYAIIIGLGGVEALEHLDAVTHAVVDTLRYTAPVSGSTAP